MLFRKTPTCNKFEFLSDTFQRNTVEIVLNITKKPLNSREKCRFKSVLTTMKFSQYFIYLTEWFQQQNEFTQNVLERRKTLPVWTLCCIKDIKPCDLC